MSHGDQTSAGRLAWTPVFTGPAWAAYAVESMLNDAGFPTFLPSANTRELQPDLFAGGAFLVQVCVPGDAVDAARSLVAASPYAS